ncbi:MAG: GAF domain-containing protein [Acidaminobacteraceae bacterium]
MKKLIRSTLESSIVIIAVFYYFFILKDNPNAFLDSNPSPLFMLSLGMGLMYGNLVGMWIATICTFFVVYTLTRLGIPTSAIILKFDYFKFPLMFFWSGILGGLNKDGYLRNIAVLKKKSQQLEYDNKYLGKLYKTSMNIQKELKMQIVGEENSLMSIYEIAIRLKTLEPEQVFTETLGILKKYLGANTVSIYSVDKKNNFLRLKIRSGDMITEKSSLNLDSSEWFLKVVNEKRIVRWADTPEKDFPILSAPLIDGDEVIAIINIESMDFHKLSEYAFNTFKIVIEWVNVTLVRALSFNKLKSSEYYDNTRILKFNNFIKRLSIEKQRADEYNLEYLYLTYKSKERSLEVINEKVSSFLRTLDVVSYEPIGNKIYFLLPATPLNKKSIIEDRLFSKLSDVLIFDIEEIIVDTKKVSL